MNSSLRFALVAWLTSLSACPAPNAVPDALVQMDATAADVIDATSETAPTPDSSIDVAPAFDASGTFVDAASGWALTVYYTPVERFHTDPVTAVTGCTTLDCTMGHADLGSYPADFVQAVQDEGTGRITSGTYAGQYLNWSIDVGYWLDTGPRDARGMDLVPFVSAAADPAIPYDLAFRVLDCGVDDTSGTPTDTAVCTQLENAHWVVRDRFTVGAVGAHFDLYIGEEDAPDFANTSPRVISTQGAVIRFGP